MAISISTAAAQAEGTSLATTIGSNPTIEIRTGSKPATPETAATGTLLATVAISGSFTSTGGVVTSGDPAAVTAAATGSADNGYFRVKTSGGTAVIDGEIGAGKDMTLDTYDFVAGGTVDLGVITFTEPKS